ncbi:MAG TPA: hypothetical protein VG297_15690 [Bryobacteraceae bacterium]|nr:hypothetical protein [Bryobacteraceae bacterium]
MTQIVKLEMANGTVIKGGPQDEPEQQAYRVGRHLFDFIVGFMGGRQPVHVGIPAQRTGATSVKKCDERAVNPGSRAAARTAINGAAGQAFKKSSVGSALSGAAVLAFSYHLRFGVALVHLHRNDRANED